MRAVRLRSFGAPLIDESLPDPVPGPREVVVEVRAAGICRSDAHYRRDPGRARLPRTLGHEIAGIVGARGSGAATEPGARVAVHYLVGCGECADCRGGGERFCPKVEMFGKERDGGFAERVLVPEGNLVRVPESVPLEIAAILMCSAATALHALRIAGFRPGQTVLVSGFGGLGASAAALARALGASAVIVADVVPAKLEAAATEGALPVDGSRPDFVEQVLARTKGRGVDVALDFAGGARARTAALRTLAPGGALVVVGLDAEAFSFDPYRDLLGRERRILGCSDHLRSDLEELMDLADAGRLDLSAAVTRRVPLEAATVNAVLDDLERGTAHRRSVILPSR